MADCLELVCVQKHPELIDQCIDLLSSEWPRSRNARLVSIQQGSSESFPTNLVLIRRNETDVVVVAHCKVSPVSVQSPRACFVESVVVAKDLRGKGIGKKIMEEVEDFVKSRGISTVYLTTHDQQGFYERVGYTLCDPIVIYGGKPNFLTNNNSGFQEDKESYKKSCTSEDILTQELDNLSLNKPNGKIDDALPDSQVPNLKHPPPPPPPPLPPIQTRKASNLGQSSWRRFSNVPIANKRDIVVLTNNDSSQMKVTMKKDI